MLKKFLLWTTIGTATGLAVGYNFKQGILSRQENKIIDIQSLKLLCGNKLVLIPPEEDKSKSTEIFRALFHLYAEYFLSLILCSIQYLNEKEQTKFDLKKKILNLFKDQIESKEDSKI